MQYRFDFLVAATQVTGCIGVLHVIVVGNATGKGGEQRIADFITVDALRELRQLLSRRIIQPHGSGAVHQGRGGGRLLALDGLIALAKRRWGHSGGICRLLLFKILLFIHGF